MSGDLSLDREAIRSASSRIRAGASKSHSEARAGVMALRGLCRGGHTVIGALVDDIVQKLEAHLPDYVELAITSYGSALLEIVEEVDDADRELAIDQPDVPALGGALSSVWGAVAPSGSLGWASRTGQWALGAASTLSQGRFSMGRYTNAWSKALAWGDQHGVPESLLRFKRSPVTQFLHKYQGMLERGHWVVGTTAAGLGMVEPLQNAFESAANGDARNSFFDTIDAGSNLVKNPLYSVNVRLWSEVGRAATNPEIDWSPNGVKQIFTASPSEWGRAIVEGVQSNEGRRAFHNIFGL